MYVVHYCSMPLPYISNDTIVVFFRNLEHIITVVLGETYISVNSIVQISLADVSLYSDEYACIREWRIMLTIWSHIYALLE